MVTEFFSEPVFYQPTAGGAFQPIEIGFDAVSGSGPSAASHEAPIAVTVGPADLATGFLGLQRGSQVIRYRLPAGVQTASPGRKPTLAGGRATFADFLPGGIDFQVVPLPTGVKSFLVLKQRLAASSFTFAVDVPGLTLSVQPDGSVVFKNASGATVAAMPRPYMVDSAVNTRLGGGTYSEAVTLSVANAGPLQLVTISADTAFLDAATYPVYLDPSTSYTTTFEASKDAFVSSKYPDSNCDVCVRPDAPGYNELWLGKSPGDTDRNAVFLKFDLSSLGSVTVEEATFDVFQYHQYFNAPAVTRTWLDRITSGLGRSTITWNNEPRVDLLHVNDAVADGVQPLGVVVVLSGRMQKSPTTIVPRACRPRDWLHDGQRVPRLDSALGRVGGGIARELQARIAGWNQALGGLKGTTETSASYSGSGPSSVVNRITGLEVGQDSARAVARHTLQARSAIAQAAAAVLLAR